MKKILSLTLTLLVLLGSFCFFASAEEASGKSIEAYVTIADKGTLTTSYEKLTVNDKDGDSAITLNDALICAHDKSYNGGADAGYAYSVGPYGLGIDKLWGDTSYNFGYYLNNAPAFGLTDPISDGDHVYAFVYKNSDFSDQYAFFDKNTVNANKGDEITLTLFSAGYDEAWNPVTLPVKGATVTFDGEKTEYVTDAEGKVTLKLTKAGEVLIGAVSDSFTLVPPVLRASVTPSFDATAIIAICAVAALAVAVVAVFFIIRKKKSIEK